MKRITILLSMSCLMMQLHAQTLREKISMQAHLTAGMPLADSDIKSLAFLTSAEYQLHPRFSAGIGAGLSKYEHLMLPVFASCHWRISHIALHLLLHVTLVMLLHPRSMSAEVSICRPLLA